MRWPLLLLPLTACYPFLWSSRDDSADRGAGTGTKTGTAQIGEDPGFTQQSLGTWDQVDVESGRYPVRSLVDPDGFVYVVTSKWDSDHRLLRIDQRTLATTDVDLADPHDRSALQLVLGPGDRLWILWGSREITIVDKDGGNPVEIALPGPADTIAVVDDTVWVSEIANDWIAEVGEGGAQPPVTMDTSEPPHLGRMVSIDGSSFWMVLNDADGSDLEDTLLHFTAPPAFEEVELTGLCGGVSPLRASPDGRLWTTSWCYDGGDEYYLWSATDAQGSTEWFEPTFPAFDVAVAGASTSDHAFWGVGVGAPSEGLLMTATSIDADPVWLADDVNLLAGNSNWLQLVGADASGRMWVQVTDVDEASVLGGSLRRLTPVVR